MKRLCSLPIFLLAVISASGLPGRCDPPPGAIVPSAFGLPAQTQRVSRVGDADRLPLTFEKNQGQTDPHVRFLAHIGNSALFLTPSEAVFSLPVSSAAHSSETVGVRNDRNSHRAVEKIGRLVVRMQIVGAKAEAAPLTQQPLGGRINYFCGNDPSKWHTGVPTFGRVGFHQVYPGVDLVYYGNQRQLEYDFVVAPHADPKQIRLHFAGTQGVRIDAEGDLIVRTQGCELMWRKPVVYQQDATGKHGIPAHFQRQRLPNGTTGVGFALGRYDAARPLVIDPVLFYSTYLGGSVGDEANSIVVDSAGNAYVVGSAMSTDFPTTSGAFQRLNNAPAGKNSSNTFVTKINAAGTSLVYSTYLGGSGIHTDQANSIAIDSSGNAYVTGYTSSPDFPTTAGAFQRVNNDQTNGYFNAFVTKLDPTGSSLLYSTYLGGSGGYGDQGHSIAIDSSGNAYIAGSAHSTDFPTTVGAFQRVNKARGVGGNAFVTKLNATGTALLYSTYLGGSGLNGEQINGIVVDSSGNAYVTGPTSSTDFPTTTGAFQTANGVHDQTSYNAFVTKINPSGAALVYSTYIGGTTNVGDQANAIALDSSGNTYIVGAASSTDFPITAGAFQRVNHAQAGYDNGFVAKLNASGTALLYATYLGGSGASFDHAISVAVDSAGNAYVVGAAYSADFPTTPGALQRTNNEVSPNSGSAFVTKLNAAGAGLLYSTYLGGSFSNGDAAYAVALDSSGNAYVTGFTCAPDFPVTAGAFQRAHKALSVGGANAFITKMSLVPVFPDFNNDGNPDLLLQNFATGQIAYGFLVGPAGAGAAGFSLTLPADYALVGVGDFGGYRTPTLVLQSRTTNQIAFWYTSAANSAIISGGHFVNVTPDPGWKVVAVGDFNGDGKSDLVLQNQTTNQVAIWFMNDYLYQGGVLLPFTPPIGWTVAGAGDFNKDGSPDLVFQNQTTNQIAIWFMNGATYLGGIVMPIAPAPGWSIAAVDDYNGDGYADLIFQNQAGTQYAVWYLRNGAYTGGALLPVLFPPGMKIVGPR